MLLRLVVTLLAFALSVPAACFESQKQPEPDCCRKSQNCPKPVKAQPCMNCGVELRASAVAPEQMVHAVVPLTAASAKPAEFIILRVPARVLSIDKSDTYLRAGVLRI